MYVYHWVQEKKQIGLWILPPVGLHLAHSCGRVNSVISEES